MKKNIDRKLNIALSAVEAMLLSAIAYLEYLSGYKAGVMKHMYFKKMQYMSGIYSPQNMRLHMMIVVAVLVFITFNRNRIVEKQERFASMKTILLIIAFIASQNIMAIRDMNSYAYLLMCIEAMIGLETLNMARMIMKKEQ